MEQDHRSDGGGSYTHEQGEQIGRHTMNTLSKSRFDLLQVGAADRHNLAATFCEACLRFYDDPKNRERFEEWQKQRTGETHTKPIPTP